MMQHYFGTKLEVVDNEVNKQAPPSSLGSLENKVNQGNDKGIELPQMNRHYPCVQNTPDQYGLNVRTHS